MWTTKMFSCYFSILILGVSILFCSESSGASCKLPPTPTGVKIIDQDFDRMGNEMEHSFVYARIFNDKDGAKMEIFETNTLDMVRSKCPEFKKVGTWNVKDNSKPFKFTTETLLDIKTGYLTQDEGDYSAMFTFMPFTKDGFEPFHCYYEYKEFPVNPKVECDRY